MKKYLRELILEGQQLTSKKESLSKGSNYVLYNLDSNWLALDSTQVSHNISQEEIRHTEEEARSVELEIEKQMKIYEK